MSQTIQDIAASSEEGASVSEAMKDQANKMMEAVHEIEMHVG